MRRGNWVDRGADVDWDKALKYGLDTHFVYAADIEKAAQNVKNIVARGKTPGIWYAQTHSPDLGPEAFASEVNRLTGDVLEAAGYPRTGQGSALEVMIDEEEGYTKFPDPTEFTRRWIIQWRKHRPGRRTWWGLRAGQGGWVKGITQLLLSKSIYVVPYAYGGQMEPFAPHGVMEELESFGISRHIITPFLDGNLIHPDDRWWRGVVFQQSDLG